MSIEISDKSVDLALVKACGQLGVSHKDVQYRVISEEKKLWGLLGKKVTIEAWTRKENRNQERQTQFQTDKHDAEVRKYVSVSSDTLEDIHKFCEKLCALISNEPVKIRSKTNENSFILSCQNDFLAEKLEKIPKLSESIERIILKVYKDKIEDKNFRLFFDANDVRLGKEKELIALARNLAKKAVKTQKTITLNYKHASDRKIVHMTLESDSKVYTKSVGSGPNRKLLIIPAKDGGRKSRGLSS